MMSNVATLALEDGTILRGQAFGAAADAVFELVFTTSMAGYQEILTDLLPRNWAFCCSCAPPTCWAAARCALWKTKINSKGSCKKPLPPRPASRCSWIASSKMLTRPMWTRWPMASEW